MIQEEADRELGSIVRGVLVRSIEDGAGREIDVAIDVAEVGLVLARVHVDLADKYIY